MRTRTTVDTPLGPFTVLAGPNGVVHTRFDAEEGAIPEADEVVERVDPSIRSEVEAYFAGSLRRFTTPVDLSDLGEGFARRVLEAVRTIPYAELRTYGDVAGAAGAPRGGRAAGSVLARCPIELFVPCHRVVRAGPSLGSYGRHPERRRFLLELEGVLAVASRKP